VKIQSGKFRRPPQWVKFGLLRGAGGNLYYPRRKGVSHGDAKPVHEMNWLEENAGEKIMKTDLPATMKALVLKPGTNDALHPGRCLELAHKPMPKLIKGEVLVKMEAASANPSDLLSLRGRYAINPVKGQTCGIEGVGRVISSSAGILGQFLKGRRVAVARPEGEGVWAEYAAIAASNCIPVGDGLPMESAAAFVVNPFTSYALIQKAHKKRATAVVQTAGASQVGKGVIALAKAAKIETISIVRRSEQVTLLTDMGAKHVLNQNDPDFDAKLKALCDQLNPTLFFDAVGGPLTAHVMEAMPKETDAIIFGYLEENSTDPHGGHFPTQSVIYKNQTIKAFWLAPYFIELGQIGGLRASLDILKLFKSGVFKTKVASVSGFEDYPSALDAYAANMSGGKALLKIS
jgi:NADPH:quinone reductase